MLEWHILPCFSAAVSFHVVVVPGFPYSPGRELVRCGKEEVEGREKCLWITNHTLLWWKGAAVRAPITVELY